jgi:hypothetical protein
MSAHPIELRAESLRFARSFEALLIAGSLYVLAALIAG